VDKRRAVLSGTGAVTGRSGPKTISETASGKNHSLQCSANFAAQSTVTRLEAALTGRQRCLPPPWSGTLPSPAVRDDGGFQPPVECGCQVAPRYDLKAAVTLTPPARDGNLGR
jgi:hypothetical protein